MARTRKTTRKATRHKAKRPRKTMAAAAKRTTKKSAKRSAKHARKSDKMPPWMPARPFGYSRDSVMNALAGVLILFALISAGIMYPQPKPAGMTAPAPAVMQKK